MKFLTVLMMLLGSHALADTTTCTAAEFPDRVYRIVGQFPEYTFTISQIVVDPVSCRSRWGCDESEELIYQEEMIAEDWQGEYVYKGKRSEIYYPYSEGIIYSYPFKTANGEFVTKSIKLTCEDQE